LRSQAFLMLARWIKDGSLAIQCCDQQEQEEILEELDAMQLWNIEKD
jgi:hypothetical protein